MPPTVPVLPIPRRAAMYVRMSTEHQQYSMVNQSDAIEKYATDHNLHIVKRFADPGRSGLTLAGRPGLRQLLLEIISGRPEFSEVLVYDVSRWGRFQDIDESAYYEYTCKKANVKVHYCLEQFENDGSAHSTLIKALKRTMAAEYSREVSAKVFGAQVRLVLAGYKQGGRAGYGLRRLVIDAEGKRKTILKRGETKLLQSDRVILIPGPKREIAIVRSIFEWSTIEGISDGQIARRLNARNIKLEPEPRCPDPMWNQKRVCEILTNPKYVGANVYNRKSSRLKLREVRNPQEDWVRLDGAFTPLISSERFEAAQKARQWRTRHLTNEQILEGLRSLLKKEGRLSQPIINRNLKRATSTIICQRFGGLQQAYELIGYKR